MMSCGNDTVPHPEGMQCPKGLSEPTQIEEMLLARFFPTLRVFFLGNGEFGCKGSVLNVEQDASPL